MEDADTDQVLFRLKPGISAVKIAELGKAVTDMVGQVAGKVEQSDRDNNADVIA